MKSLSPGFQPGNYWVVCDRCAFSYRRSDMRKEWNGLVVCKKCWETRHPQDFVRAVSDTIAPQGLNRPEPTEIFVTGTEGSGGASQTIPPPTHGTDPN